MMEAPNTEVQADAGVAVEGQSAPLAAEAKKPPQDTAPAKEATQEAPAAAQDGTKDEGNTSAQEDDDADARPRFRTPTFDEWIDAGYEAEHYPPAMVTKMADLERRVGVLETKIRHWVG